MPIIGLCIVTFFLLFCLLYTCCSKQSEQKSKPKWRQRSDSIELEEEEEIFPRVPNVFHLSILRLPHVPILNIIRNWNTRELYNFSSLSTKTNQLAKMVKAKNPSRITFWCPYEVILTYSKEKRDRWFFGVFTNTLSRHNGLPNTSKWRRYISIKNNNLFPTILEVLTDVQGIFNSTIHKIRLDSDYLSLDKLKLVVNCINLMEKVDGVSKIEIHIHDRKFLKFFMENFQKNLENLEICGDEFYDTTTNFSFFQRFQLKNLTVFNGNWIYLNNLLTMNFVNAYLEDVSLTSQGLNMFLKSWQSGSVHQKLEQCSLKIKKKIDLKIVLNGLSAELRNPRTTKRCYRNENRIFWIHGGIDIQKTDGTIGTIKLFCLETENEREEVSQKIINEYEKASRNWKYLNGNGKKYRRFQEIIDNYCLSFVVWNSMV